MNWLQKTARRWQLGYGLRILVFTAPLFSWACVFTTTFKGPGVENNQISTDQTELVVALTNVIVNRDKRGPFDRGTRNIVEQIDKYPGYIGGSFRFEILGDELWTMSIWEDEESLDAFVHDRLHLDAMYQGSSAVVKMRSKTFTVKTSDLPLTWEQAIKELEGLPMQPLEYL